MKPLHLDDMIHYRYLSDLKLDDHHHTLYYTETMADLEHNSYQQRLHKMNTQTKQSEVLIDWKTRCSTFLMNDGTLLFADHAPELSTIHTRFTKILCDGTTEPAFTLPLAVGNIKDINENYYLVNATIHRSCPNYHHLSLKEQLQIEQMKKDNEDYVIFDEYPFFFNGAGIINGERNTLMLLDKKTFNLIDLIPSTIDVESYDIDKDELIYSGVDFTDVKGLWSWVWKVNLNTRKTEVLFDKTMMIGRVFFMNHKVIVTGTNGTAVDGRDFYELKDKQLHLLMKNEGSLYNSVGSDCRYGRTKNYYKFDDTSYFISTEDSHSDVLKYTGSTFEKMTSFEGSSDDMVIGKDGLWIIAMTEQKLQEVYEVIDGNPVQRTFLNEDILKDVYVAKPRRLSIENQDTVYGWVLLPKDYDPQKKYPAILDVHGGPKGVYGENFYHEMQAWASLGYFVMFCNPHCSDGRGNEFANYMKHYGVTDYEDIMKFVDEVIRLYPAIDPERIGVTGGSYGGYMTNWIITHTDRFKCAASQRSVSNRITQMVYSDYGIDTPFEFGVEDINDCYDLFWDRSPLKYANNAVTPTLFIHATEDYRCPISEAIQLYTVLKCHGVDTKLVGFVGENHELSRAGKPKHRLRRLHEITNWMEKYLK